VTAAMLAGPSRIEIHEVAVEGAASRQIMLSLLVSARFALDETAAALRPAGAGAPGARIVLIHV
jgi:hypothetical protein